MLQIVVVSSPAEELEVALRDRWPQDTVTRFFSAAEQLDASAPDAEVAPGGRI